MKINQQVVAADTKYIIQVPPGLVTYDIHNDSPWNMAVNLGSDSGLDDAEYYMSPHSILYGLSSANTGPGYSVGGSRGATQIFVYTQTPIGGGTVTPGSAPAQSLTIMGYPVGRAPQSTVSLNRFVGVGNAVTTTQPNLIQDGSPVNTTLVEATHSGASISSVFLDNSGNLTLTASIQHIGPPIITTNTQLLKVDATNLLIALGDPAAGLGNVQINSVLAINTQPTVINGTVGTATCYQALTGSGLKVAIIIENGFRNGGASPLNWTLTAPFTATGRWWSGDTNPITLRNAGAAQNNGIITALAVGGGTVAISTTISKYSMGDCAGPFDTISFNSGEASVHSGIQVFIGI